MIGRGIVLAIAAAALITASLPSTAQAHPHVWVDVRATVAYKDGNIVGLKQIWTFDDMYTAMAIQGMDKNGDGKYDREELQELAKVNIDGIKQFAYFTFAKLGTEALPFAEPQEYWLEHEDNVLTLHFVLPLKSPLPASKPGFSFSIYDPTYFIAFDFAKDNPVLLGEGAPAGCAVDVSAPPTGSEAADLADAFASELGGGYDGSALSRNVTVNCARS